MRLVPLLVGCSFLFAPLSYSAEVGFVEDFALASKRSEALAQLVPGSVDYYFYHCLDAQHRDDLDAVDRLMKEWRRVRNYHHGGHYRTIEVRQHLFRAGENPKKAFDELNRFLYLQLNHQSDAAQHAITFPHRLDPKKISWQAYVSRYGVDTRHLTTEGIYHSFSDRAFVYHISKLNNSRIYPDHPKVFSLILADLQATRGTNFGKRPQHKHLTLEQLDTLKQKVSALIDQKTFILAYAKRLAPSQNITDDLSDDQRLAWLERLQTFAKNLPPVHNNFKAAVLFHRLEFDAQKGIFDRQRWQAYLQIPRQASYSNRQWLRQNSNRNYIAQLNYRIPGMSGSIAPQRDVELTREALLNILAKEPNSDVFAKYLDPKWLNKLFAEAKILGGVGDAEKWFAEVDDPVWTKEIGERIDLIFAPDNSATLAPRTMSASNSSVKISVNSI